METITKAGDVLIEALEIITAKNKTIDIRPQLLELNLFEDLYTDCLSGTVMIQDSLGFLAGLPMVGEEQIHVKLRTPTLKKEQGIDRTFFIYKISDRIIKERTLVYQIHFISIEAIIDSNKAISRAFGGKCSEMVNDILRQSIFLGTNKNLNVETTSNSLSFIPAYWSPFKCLTYVTKRSLNSKGNAGYLFYESSRSFNFTSTDVLLAQKPMQDYVYSETSAREKTGSNYKEQYKKILAIRQDTVFDYLDRLQSGMYASKITLINPINKNVEVVGLNYSDYFKRTNHTDKYPLNTVKVEGAKDSNLLFETYEPFVYDSMASKSSQWKIQRRHLMSSMNAIKMEIEVNGRTDIEVGKMVNVKLPSFAPINEGDRTKDITDNLYSGNYLITAINHRINILPAGVSHQMVMEIVKDSSGVKLEK